jgi:anhydro-N-acetylmuramic acid kinase
MEKKEIYRALGLMSGTSMDGVDASIVCSSDGKNYITASKESRYFEYDKGLYQKITILRDKITSSKDLKKYSHELKSIEKEITLFHAKVANIMIKATSEKDPDIIGLHGQTIFHNSDEKISIQLGDGKLLSQLTKKNVVYNFRQNDLKNGGQGAPLTPIFHQYLVKKLSDEWWPILVLNIGGISNVTSISRLQEPIYNENNLNAEMKLFAGDIAPGNC